MGQIRGAATQGGQNEQRHACTPADVLPPKLLGRGEGASSPLHFGGDVGRIVLGVQFCKPKVGDLKAERRVLGG
jgi:hypothetical protein